MVQMLVSIVIWLGTGLVLTTTLATLLQSWFAPPQQTLEAYVPPKHPPAYSAPRSETLDYSPDAARLSWQQQ